jgi:hypothetical protein
MQSALRALLMLQCLTVLAGADVRQQEFQKWVDDSTLIFTGTIWVMNSPLVQKRSVAAAEIDRPKLANIL